MKKRLSNLFARFRQPKWRHGKLGVLLVAGFLVICVLVNVFIQALEDEYGWRTDLSFNAYATTGEETRAVLDRLKNDVDLYLLYQSGAEDTQLLQLLNRYAVLSDRIAVKETDIAQNPGILTRFPGDADKIAQADSVIVSCEATGRYKILDYTDFLTQGYDIESGSFQPEGLSYEKSLTEAIASVAQNDPPTVGVVQGHGELTPDALDLLLSFLESNGYDHVTVDLSAEDASRTWPFCSSPRHRRISAMRSSKRSTSLPKRAAACSSPATTPTRWTACPITSPCCAAMG